MIEKNFLSFLKSPQIEEGEPNFSRGTNSAEQMNYLKAANFISFISSQCILHDLAVLFSVFKIFSN